MPDPNLEGIAIKLQEYVYTRAGVSVDIAELEGTLRQVLCDPRDLWDAYRMGIVTREEVCRNVAGRVHRRLVQLGVTTYDDAADWQPLVSIVEYALLDAGHGPPTDP